MRQYQKSWVICTFSIFLCVEVVACKARFGDKSHVSSGLSPATTSTPAHARFYYVKTVKEEQDVIDSVVATMKKTACVDRDSVKVLVGRGGGVVGQVTNDTLTLDDCTKSFRAIDPKVSLSFDWIFKGCRKEDFKGRNFVKFSNTMPPVIEHYFAVSNTGELSQNVSDPKVSEFSVTPECEVSIEGESKFVFALVESQTGTVFTQVDATSKMTTQFFTPSIPFRMPLKTQFSCTSSNATGTDLDIKSAIYRVDMFPPPRVLAGTTATGPAPFQFQIDNVYPDSVVALNVTNYSNASTWFFGRVARTAVDLKFSTSRWEFKFADNAVLGKELLGRAFLGGKFQTPSKKAFEVEIDYDGSGSGPNSSILVPNFNKASLRCELD